MSLKQLSVFMENREGRLNDVAETLAKNNINIISLSLADTTEYGMLRLIVSDGEKGKSALKEAGFSAMLTDVIAIKVKDEVGSLQNILKFISLEGLNVEYMYTLNANNNICLVVKTSDLDKSAEIIGKNGYEIADAKEIYNA